MTPVTCIVPARMASTRFPGKPLVDIGGLPLVVRSARRALAANCFAQVVVATEDPIIAETCAGYNLESILTPTFPTGTDRVAWAAHQLQCPWVINLQGDEPVFPLDLLRDLCDQLPTDPSALWTAADTALTEADRTDDDVVKIELGEGDPAQALDFFRTLPADASSRNFAIHVGVYGGSLEALSRFAALPVPPLETLRRIEPLRALAAGMPVRARKGSWPRAAIDRREHISTVLRMLEGVT
jgi:3-deoxy-manno-octulosonate cytidylyltransferase (CMP-KDO synthetase)